MLFKYHQQSFNEVNINTSIFMELDSKYDQSGGLEGGSWLTVAWSNGKALSKLLQASWTGSDRCGESSNVSMW